MPKNFSPQEVEDYAKSLICFYEDDDQEWREICREPRHKHDWLQGAKRALQDIADAKDQALLEFQRAKDADVSWSRGYHPPSHERHVLVELRNGTVREDRFSKKFQEWHTFNGEVEWWREMPKRVFNTPT